MLRVIHSGEQDPRANMGLDEALLDSADSPPTLRLYRWSPAGLSLGYFQSMEICNRLAGGEHVIVRRITGGGAIYHDDEITFALTIDAAALPAAIPESYELILLIYRWIRSRRRSTRPRSASACPWPAPMSHGCT